MMQRRSFLKLMGAAALGSGLVRAEWALSTAPDLAVVTGPTKKAVRKAVDMLGGMKRFVGPGQRVVIKPNMSFPRTVEQGSNTTPQAVSEVARLCLAAGAGKVLILDNPLAPAERCLERSGIRAACEIVKSGMVHMIESPGMFEEVEIKGARAIKKTAVMKQVLRSDVLIAVPTAKSHSGAGVSLAMKGMMGLVSDRWAFHSSGLSQGIVDLASRLRPSLSIVDATRVLTTGGPGGPGKVVTPNMIIAGTDMVAVDAYAVASFPWYGRRYQPRQVPHIKLAHERGLGRMDVENLSVAKVTL